MRARLMGVTLFSDEAMLEHVPGEGHPERPARLTAALAAAKARGAAVKAPPEVRRSDLELVHTPAYIDRILACDGIARSLDPDTHTSPGSVRAAKLAAGALVAAVDQVLDEVQRQDAKKAFCLVRPPGHHATADTAMGFCLFNNVAVAAARAIAVHGKERVLVVDWDVHHGNGTEAIFYDRPDVLVFNTHQAPYYPGTGPTHATGQGAGVGFTVNVPLPAGATPADYRDAYEHLLVPIARAYRPELILVSAGFDAHEDDPLAMHELDDDAYGWLAATVRDLADELCDGRLVVTLEGGYDTAALERSIGKVLDVLDGGSANRPSGTPRHPRHVEEAAAAQRSHWPIG